MEIRFEKEREFIDMLINNHALFEIEFENIKKEYPMDNPNKIHDFLKDNLGVMIILNNIKPLLLKHVPYSYFNLRLDENPIFVPQLLLIVNAPRNKFGNGFKDNIKKINRSIHPFLLEFDLTTEFFIFEGLLQDD